MPPFIDPQSTCHEQNDARSLNSNDKKRLNQSARKRSWKNDKTWRGWSLDRKCRSTNFMDWETFEFWAFQPMAWVPGCPMANVPEFKFTFENGFLLLIKCLPKTWSSIPIINVGECRFKQSTDFVKESARIRRKTMALLSIVRLRTFEWIAALCAFSDCFLLDQFCF